MSMHETLIVRVSDNKINFKSRRYRVGAFLVQDLSKKTYAQYRKSFIGVVKENPNLVPENTDAEDYALFTFEESIFSFDFENEDADFPKPCAVFANIVPETQILNFCGFTIKFDDAAKLQNIDADVELRVGVCDTFEGPKVGFIVKIIVERWLYFDKYR